MRGQAFSVFKVLIGAVIAVVMLIMVMGATGNLQYPEAGFEATARLVTQAAKAPSLCFSAERVRFTLGESADLGAITGKSVGVSKTALYQDSIQTSGGSISVTKDVAAAPVSVKCSSTSQCEVFIGSKECST